MCAMLFVFPTAIWSSIDAIVLPMQYWAVEFTTPAAAHACGRPR